MKWLPSQNESDGDGDGEHVEKMWCFCPACPHYLAKLPHYNPCYDGQIKHFLVKRMMVSGTTDNILFQKSHLWVKSKKGCVLC